VRYDLIRGHELRGELRQRWREIQEADRAYASPFFCPEFTEHVAAVRDDVSIAVLEEAGRVVGFFPFHRRRGGVGRPVGLGLSDYHGVVAEPRVHWDVEGLLKACGLVSYEFDHLPVSQVEFGANVERVCKSPIVGLVDGFRAFRETRGKAGRKQLREVERKREKLAEDGNPIKFVVSSSDGDVLRKLMEWKSAQCGRTGTFDYFGLKWCRRLVEGILRCEASSFGGVLSCLYVGESLIAAHFGMRSKTVWHSWFPAYSQEWRAYSPGMVLLVEIIRAGAGQGMGYLDFGKGMSTYKKRFMTDAIDVGEGRVEIASVINSARRVRERAEEWARTSALRPILLFGGRVVRWIERRRRYD
jgi:CelD/BcsL family acetyltransferase involved in cellulose biosynthesis